MTPRAAGPGPPPQPPWAVVLARPPPRPPVEGPLSAPFGVKPIGEPTPAPPPPAPARGNPTPPPRHTVYTEIKAVTFHGMDIRETDDGWAVQVIFDM